VGRGRWGKGSTNNVTDVLKAGGLSNLRSSGKSEKGKGREAQERGRVTETSLQREILKFWGGGWVRGVCAVRKGDLRKEVTLKYSYPADLCKRKTTHPRMETKTKPWHQHIATFEATQEGGSRKGCWSSGLVKGEFGGRREAGTEKKTTSKGGKMETQRSARRELKE